MPQGNRAETLDNRLLLRIYAVICGLAGMMIVGWGPVWFGTDLPGTPFGKAALARVFGSVLVAVAC